MVDDDRVPDLKRWPATSRRLRALRERAILDSNQWPSAPENGQASSATSVLVQPVDKTGLGCEEHGAVGRLGPPWTTNRGTPAGPGEGEMRPVNPLVEPLLSVREVARALRVAPYTVYGLCDRGELPHVRVSSAIRVRPVDLQAFVRGRK